MPFPLYEIPPVLISKYQYILRPCWFYQPLSALSSSKCPIRGLTYDTNSTMAKINTFLFALLLTISSLRRGTMHNNHGFGSWRNIKFQPLVSSLFISSLPPSPWDYTTLVYKAQGSMSELLILALVLTVLLRLKQVALTPKSNLKPVLSEAFPTFPLGPVFLFWVPSPYPQMILTVF